MRRRKANTDGIDVTHFGFDDNRRIEVFDEHLLEKVTGAIQEAAAGADGHDLATVVSVICPCELFAV